MDTFADWLRACGDAELRELLSARPELITPVPANLDALAARAAAPAAVARALDRLDTFTLAALEALIVLDRPAPYESFREALAEAADEDARAALRRLRSYGLVWGDDEGLRAAPGVRQGIGHPAGLGPPAREAFATYAPERLADLVGDLDGDRPRGFTDAERLIERLEARLAEPAALLADAGPEAEVALDRLAWGPPVGRVAEARRPVRVDTARTPIERLLARGLLAATDDRTVTLPREVALYLRGGRIFRDLSAAPPPLTGTPVPGGRDLVTRTAAGQAFTAVRMVEDLLERWGLRPPGVLRSGGLAVRDLRAVATALDIEEWQAALLVEVAYAAGLLARSDGMEGDWLPTHAYDLWRMREVADRWVELATAWLGTDRVPGLAGERDDRDRLINALGDEAIRGGAPPVRRAALEALAAADDGTAPGADSVRARLAWLRPRRWGAPAPGGGSFRDRMVGWTLREAEVLGVTGFGVPAAYARDLLDRTREPSAPAAAADMPASYARPADVPTSGGKTADVRTADVPTAGAKAADVRTADGRTTGARAADGRAADGRAAGARAADVPAADVRAADVRAAGGRAADVRAAGGRAADVRASGATATGARAAGGRATGGRATGAKATGARVAGAKAAGVRAADPAGTLAGFLPEPVDQVLIQADLTAVAPGPLVAELASELALTADVESTGGATVYRFTPESVRRALDAGRSAADLKALLDRHSATPVPQPLTYIIDDVARRHGHLRVGAASSYVRSDDPATLDEILADRRASSLRLHRLAPTVLASRLARSELVEALRTLGFAPVAESPEGGVVITRLDAQRAAAPPDLTWSRHPSEDTGSMITAAVRALRAGDEAARHGAAVARLRQEAPAGEPPRSPSMATVDELRRAVESGGRVWIGYLDQQGQASSRIVEPVRLEGGFVTGYDATRAAVHRFALHRITGVAAVDGASADPPDPPR